jgi:hypothetical protein
MMLLVSDGGALEHIICFFAPVYVLLFWGLLACWTWVLSLFVLPFHFPPLLSVLFNEVY